jgi:hypothetical protein
MVRQSPRARQAKSKARVTAYDALVAQSAEGAGDGADRIAARAAPGDLVSRQKRP